jgi:hypothetical protein
MAMPNEIEAIQANLIKIQELIEVASLYQRKMQMTDDRISNQVKRQVQMNSLLNVLNE